MKLFLFGVNQKIKLLDRSNLNNIKLSINTLKSGVYGVTINNKDIIYTLHILATYNMDL